MKKKNKSKNSKHHNIKMILTNFNNQKRNITMKTNNKINILTKNNKIIIMMNLNLQHKWITNIKILNIMITMN